MSLCRLSFPVLPTNLLLLRISGNGRKRVRRRGPPTEWIGEARRRRSWPFTLDIQRRDRRHCKMIRRSFSSGREIYRSVVYPLSPRHTLSGTPHGRSPNMIGSEYEGLGLDRRPRNPRPWQCPGFLDESKSRRRSIWRSYTRFVNSTFHPSHTSNKVPDETPFGLENRYPSLDRKEKPTGDLRLPRGCGLPEVKTVGIGSPLYLD